MKVRGVWFDVLGRVQKQVSNAVCFVNFLIMLYKFQSSMQSIQNAINQKRYAPSSSQNKTELALLEEKSISLSPNTQEIRFFRYTGDKDKKIKRKPYSIIEKLRIEAPFSFQHVTNFLNMLSINEGAMKDKSFEQSYFRSIFYIKSIEKVEVRKNALILYLKNSHNLQSQPEKNKIQYLIQRYKSFGDQQFYQLALHLENTSKKYAQTNFNAGLKKCYQSEPLSRFIESMQDKIYSCKVAPNKLILSRALLQLLGEDMQTFALRLCKYKTPMQEIISSEHYSAVMSKSIQTIGLLCDFLQQKIDFQTLQNQSYMQFYDYLCSKKEKKIYCQLKVYMPTPLMNCLEVIEVKNELQNLPQITMADSKKRKLLTDQVQEIRYRETESLKHLTTVQENMLTENKYKVAGILQLPNRHMFHEILGQ